MQCLHQLGLLGSISSSWIIDHCQSDRFKLRSFMAHKEFTHLGVRSVITNGYTTDCLSSIAEGQANGVAIEAADFLKPAQALPGNANE
jgi:hypothetical protein